MKSILKGTLTTGSIYFTAFMGIFTLMGLGFVGPTQGILYSLTFLLAAFLLAAFHTLWFTDVAIKHLSYPLRILSFSITAYASLVLCALLGNWFPAANLYAWIIFTGIFLVILAAFCIGYQIRFKRAGENFDEALRKYHEENEKRQEDGRASK
jgi:hypothetical protein